MIKRAPWYHPLTTIERSDWTQAEWDRYAEMFRPATYFGDIHDTEAWKTRDSARNCLVIAKQNAERGDIAFADRYIRRAIVHGARISRIRPIFSNREWRELREFERAREGEASTAHSP